jgi:aspartyl-tRNA(Asn)/glutamyl-tRNA(Gln) amidotransferase subunit B
MTATNTWEPVIGLELHVQLKTETKMFCRCRNIGGGPEHADVPVCLAFPGALPSRTSARSVIKLGLIALDSARSRAARSSTARTALPRPAEGTRSASTTTALRERQARRPDRRRRRADRHPQAHLGEDAAKNVHVAASGRLHRATATLVGLNRGGGHW